MSSTDKISMTGPDLAKKARLAAHRHNVTLKDMFDGIAHDGSALLQRLECTKHPKLVTINKVAAAIERAEGLSCGQTS